MKKVFYFIISVIIIGILIFILGKMIFFKNNDEVVINHHVIVGQIEELGNLEVAKYSIQDVMEYKKKRTWLPNSEVSVLIKGEVISCIDLSTITEDDVYINKDSISIRLPQPQICHEKINHSQSKVYNVSFGLWETTELVDEAYKEAEIHLHKTAVNMGIENESRDSAKKIVSQILRGVGFNKVHVSFAAPSLEVPKGR